MRLVIDTEPVALRVEPPIPGLQRPAIGKTGTTDSEKDVWFVVGLDYAALDRVRPAKRRGLAATCRPLWGW